MFKRSTHSFAVYFEKKKNISGLIIACFAFVLIIQIISYESFASQVMDDQFVIPVSVRLGSQFRHDFYN